MIRRFAFNSRLVVASLILSALLAVTARAAERNIGAATEDIPDAGEENGTYCGIYCVYAAVNGFGRTMDFSSLLQIKYVGTMYGSSIDELADAVTDNGLHAVPMMGLSRANLVSAPCPIILHVSQPSAPGYFGHWILFLGMENGKAKILDAPHKPELVPIADILARWDGVGLYISEQPITPWQLKAASMLTSENLALFAAVLVLTSLLHRFVVGRRANVFAGRPLWISIPTLMATAGVLALAWHLLAEDGYASNQVAVRTVIQQHRPSFLPKLRVPEMEQAMKDEKVVIVDARYPRDYQAGHLPGAINIPVFTTQTERRKLLDGVPKDARVVVYCQSESCQFDEALGTALVAEGIENVSLFPGGWALWEQLNPPARPINKNGADQ